MTTETHSLGSILDGLEDDLDETVDAELATSDEEDAAALAEYGELLTRRASEISELIDEHGRDATVAIKDLTAADYVDFGELHSVAKRQWADREGVDPDGDDLQTIYWVAVGLVEAPWYPEDAGLQERAAVLRGDGSPGWKAIKHFSTMIAEVNQASGNVKSYAERRAARRQTNAHT